MIVSIAKEKTKELLSSYADKLNIIGVKNATEIYFINTKEFKDCETEEGANAICGSLTVYTSTDDGEICGFDIIVDIDSHGEIKDKEIEKSFEEFKTAANEFLEQIAIAEDRDQLIKEAAEREKNKYTVSMEAFNADIKRLQKTTVIFTVVAIVAVFIAVFALLTK